jgi:hypothetical protein
MAGIAYVSAEYQKMPGRYDQATPIPQFTYGPNNEPDTAERIPRAFCYKFFSTKEYLDSYAWGHWHSPPPMQQVVHPGEEYCKCCGETHQCATAFILAHGNKYHDPAKVICEMNHFIRERNGFIPLKLASSRNLW